MAQLTRQTAASAESDPNTVGASLASTVSRLPYRVFGLDRSSLSTLQRTLLALGLLFTIGAFLRTCLDLRTYRGIDLRDRLVGARVMLAGYDPYTFYWQPGMPEEWLDPIRGEFQVHRLTKTPVTLWLYAPVARLSHRSVRLLSFCAEWLALLISVCLLVRTIKRTEWRVVFLLGAVLFFVVSDFWRQHLGASQIYVYQLLTLSSAIFIFTRRGLDSVAAGAALSALALLRPNFLLFAPALLVLGFWRSAGTMLGVFAVVVLATVPFMPPSTWSSYVAAGDKFYLLSWNRTALPSLPPIQHRGPVEGEDFRIPRWERASSTFCDFYQRLASRVRLPRLDLGAVSKGLAAAVGVLLLGLMFIRRRSAAAPIALIMMVVMCLDTEFFLPQRWGYADVMLLAPLALILPFFLETDRCAPVFLFLVVMGLVIGSLGTNLVSNYFATVLRSWLIMGSATGLSVWLWLNTPRASMIGPST